MANNLKKYQSKSITPVDEYKFTLSDELRKIAINELRESDKMREHCIKALREWILENPRIIKCRMDSIFLLKILRFRKFSIPMAQDTIERHLLYREGLYGYDFFSKLDPCKPYVLDYLEKGAVLPFPKRDKNGRLTVYVRFSLVDPSVPNIGNVLLSLMSLVHETLMEDEENQIRGLNYIFDLSGANLRQLLVLPIEIWYKLGKYYEKVSMIRIKSINVINLHPTMVFLLKIFTSSIQQKLKDRVKLFSTNVSESGVVDLDNVPIEFGGTVPLKTVTDAWKEKLLVKRDFYANYQNIKLNHALYTKEYLECSVESLKFPVNQMGINNKKQSQVDTNNLVGSFRKLEID